MMAVHSKTLHLLSLLSVVVVVCGRLDLLLVSYENPFSSLYSGLCCDTTGSMQCASDPCDNTFTLCLLPRSQSQPHSSVEYIKEAQYKKLLCPKGWFSISIGLISWNSDNITFSGEGHWINQHRGISNPIRIEGDQWKDGFKLLVLVGDIDLSGKELVNVLYASWSGDDLTNEFPLPRVARSVSNYRGPETVRDVNMAASARVRQEKPVEEEPRSKYMTTATSGATTSIVSTRVTDHVTFTEEADQDSSKSRSEDIQTTTEVSTVQTTEATTTVGQATEATTEASTVHQTTKVTTVGQATELTTEAIVSSQPVGEAPDQNLPFGLQTKQDSSDSAGRNRMVGVALGGVIGSLVLIVVTVLVAVACVGCLKRRSREDQVRLTGERTESEVTALYRGPIDNPNYTEVLPNNSPANAHQFSNSLYGALSREPTSHDSGVTSPDRHMTSPPREPVQSQYSEIRREHMADSLSEPIQAGYSVISREHMEEDGYSVVTRENMAEEEYSTVARENTTDGGYSLVTREYLEEASDSGSEQEPDSQLLTTKPEQ